MAAEGYECLFRANEMVRLLLESNEAPELHKAITKLLPLLGDARQKTRDSLHTSVWVIKVEIELGYAEEWLEHMTMLNGVETSMRKGPTRTTCVARLGFSTPQTPTIAGQAYVDAITESICALAREGEELNLSSSWKEANKDEILVPAGVKEELLPTCETTKRKELRNRDRTEILKFLMTHGDDQAPSALAIVGIGGPAKTALAKEVFEDQKVQARFEPRMWMSYDSLLDVVDDEDILPRVRGSQYLVVVDDMCFKDCMLFNFIKKIQQIGAPGSRILVTARPNQCVADIGWQSYYLKHLGVNEGEGRDLFMKMAFQAQRPRRESQVRIGEAIVKTFQGLSATAVMAIGGLLSFTNSEAEWRSLYEDELLPMINNYIKGDPCHQILRFDPFTKICYDHLPYNLKHCFAYCSLFPKEYEFDVRTLVKLWMAQGFVDQRTSSNDDDDDLEDIGYEYFLNLLGRSFFHVAKLDASGRVSKCKMQRLMRKLSLFAAGKRCQLVTRSIPDSEILRSIYHLSFGSDDFSLQSFSSMFFDSSVRDVRSILFQTGVCKVLRGRPDNLALFWTDAFNGETKNLRALDARGSPTKTLPDCIDNLKSLRYLDLSQSKNLMELPGSITKLRFLETLRLSSCLSLKKLPGDIGNLVNLRHLECEDCHSLTSLPKGFGQLTNLRTLSQIVLSEDTSKAEVELNELKQLRNLREVKIKNLKHGMGEQICTCLTEMKRIRSLSLEWESRPSPSSDTNDTMLGTCLSPKIEEFNLRGFRAIRGSSFLPSSPKNLTRLTLRKLEKCEILTSLEQCLKLKVLVVDEMHSLEYISDNVATQICQSLAELWLTELPKLKGWWRNSPPQAQKAPSFLRLSKLVIEDCPELESMPLFPTLKEGLVLDSTSWKPFELTMDYKATPNPDETSTLSSSSFPLSELSNLCIVGISEVDDSKAEEINWETLKSLRMLKFDHLSELTTLPDGLQKVTSLRELHLWRCGLERIPDWINKLELLERLVIRMCPRAKSIPESIRSLKQLRTLEIEECPTLLWRCRKDTGADWDKVAHIPELRLGRVSMQ